MGLALPRRARPVDWTAKLEQFPLLHGSFYIQTGVCGHYDLNADTPALLDVWEVQPRYSIAPSRDVPIVRDTGNSPGLALARWSLVPKI
jgi:hypothetical protein